MNGRGGKAESAERGGRSILRDERGIVLVLSALSMTMLIGFVALAVEVGLWYKTRRMLQTAADSASLAGAFAKQAGGDNAKITALASYDATRNGWSSTTGTIAVNSPPASGTDVGKS